MNDIEKDTGNKSGGCADSPLDAFTLAPFLNFREFHGAYL